MPLPNEETTPPVIKMCFVKTNPPLSYIAFPAKLIKPTKHTYPGNQLGDGVLFSVKL
jgi:hypothetical protein